MAEVHRVKKAPTWKRALSLWKKFIPCAERSQQTTLNLLQAITGEFRPGTMTLVISPPGGGISTFFKLLAGRISPEAFQGSVRLRAGEHSDAGVSPRCHRLNLCFTLLRNDDELAFFAFR